MNKIVNIIKPTGMTSHDVVSAVRKILNTKKVGHTGTLDPDASGVLPICIGKATKVSELILNKDKSYICELTLGITTDTYDSSGEILERVDNFSFTKEVSRSVKLRHTPQIIFKVDDSIKNGMYMDHLIRKVNEGATASSFDEEEFDEE